jgi:hypothetical protein
MVVLRMQGKNQLRNGFLSDCDTAAHLPQTGQQHSQSNLQRQQIHKKAPETGLENQDWTQVADIRGRHRLESRAGPGDLAGLFGFCEFSTKLSSISPPEKT